MNGDPTVALGRLLHDPALRGALRTDRAGVAAALGLPDAERGWLETLDASELEAQARALIDKRYFEVTKLLPRTLDALGAQARELFRAYAESHWPAGHQRHVLDALGFFGALERSQVRNLDAAERNRVRFLLGKRPGALHFVWGSRTAGARVALQSLVREESGSVRQRFVRLF